MKSSPSGLSNERGGHSGHSAHRNQTMLVVAAMGVVFGDIGTSPLYALRECFLGEHGYPMTPENVYGVLSMFFWSLNLVVSLKYVLFIMHAHNKGEGGILALESLARRQAQKSGFVRMMPIVTLMGLFGSALLFGDGIITPAITVLSALEGLKVATPLFEPYVVPLTVLVLVAVFSVQRYGTARIGAVFGPVTMLWFVVIGVLGFYELLRTPSVLAAMNPIYAAQFFMNNGLHSVMILGTVFLCVTGGEAMYADMGHFGRRPIKRGWFYIVLPALLLNYFGQGALILREPQAISNPFYLLAPDWALYPLVVLAGMASIIASQALISGVFSLAKQAIQMGYSPRMAIIHTSKTEIGQIYAPFVNWALLIGALWLVLTFRSSSQIAHAYGIAVSLTMLITTLLAVLIARYVWRWKVVNVALVCVPLIILDSSFFLANATKVLHGGYIPLVLAGVIMVFATTWLTGRKLLARELSQKTPRLSQFLRQLESNPPLRVHGTAVFMTSSKEGTPLPFVNNIRHNKVLHERVLFLTFLTREVPHVPRHEQVSIEPIQMLQGEKIEHPPDPAAAPASLVHVKRFEEAKPWHAPKGLFRIVVNLGFMDNADVQAILRECRNLGLMVNLGETTFFLGREIVLASQKQGMAIWREKLFAFMGRNAQSPALFFNIPPSQVIEVGMQIEI